MLEKTVGEILARRRMTLAVAESCTGGLLGSLVTDVPGSSAYFVGGVVSYANEAKRRLLGVPDEMLRQQGAVSEDVALAMARGARELFQVDVALAVTGIAGPAPETSKPVGLVYVALAASDLESCREFRWTGDRIANKRRSAEAALQLLLDYLERLL
ncbi:MAG: CinA family protein [Chloroflexota bacterium]|nr:MAG: CinA family protein [Chloroflexota bacterium]